MTSLGPSALVDIAVAELGDMTDMDVAVFTDRLAIHMPDLRRTLDGLYGETHDIEALLATFVRMAARRHGGRAAELRRLDLRRLADPAWFQSETMVGYAAYVDRYGGTLAGVGDHVDHLADLGVTYLHLLPFLRGRRGENDGGYAVEDYRAVEPRLGTWRDLETLTTTLRAAGIALCADVVCNHTADSHEWAQRAKAGDPEYQAYYLTFPDRTLPDRHEETLREIFPEAAPGSFTWVPEMNRWAWTTFRTYQWDLDYTNPAVLGEMTDIILTLANAGVEILRLDAVAFMWKRLGTGCENLPEAHLILQFFRAITRIVCPAVILKAEAIVPIDDTLPYLGTGAGTGKECELAYHHFLMVLMWSALAEQNGRLALGALRRIPETMPGPNAWCTYVRSHDDIGWAVTPQDAATAGVDDFAHRRFLTDFYTGDFPMSFARGRVFEENPLNQDRRVSGSTASLAGLEQALESGDPTALELAQRRIRTLYAVAAAAGGIPIVWSGDEWGATNDYGYATDPDLAGDNRWLHRCALDWDSPPPPESAPARVFSDLAGVLRARTSSPELHAASATIPVDVGNDAVVAILREGARGRLLIVANVSPEAQIVTPVALRPLGFAGPLRDRLTGDRIAANSTVTIEANDVLWIVSDR